MEKRLLSVKEMGERISVPASTVYRMVKNSKLPHLRIGRAIRFDADKVMAWLESEHAANAVGPSAGSEA